MTQYKVTFRNCNSKLTSMFTETFRSVNNAKDAIMADAKFFLASHRINETDVKYAQRAKWVNPKTEDYYEVRGRDGATCIYQYFKI